ncbi:hypothetical protein IKG38_03045 [Candidatus Saccharibacteria bacterium]|jgi:hypothetical protein|nr:hypothetical protein [Candidatus Saccharibacteria bacterium]
MGVIVNKQNEQNDELSRRINADLRAKAMETASVNEDGDVDFAEDADYLRDLKKTGKFGWIWVVLIVLAVISLISIIFL